MVATSSSVDSLQRGWILKPMTSRSRTPGEAARSSSTARGGASLRKFERQAPDTRRQALMDATLRCLAERGVEKTSIRNICEEAGVSVGLVNHYYSSKDALIADVYTRLADGLLASLQAEVQNLAGRPARERLGAFFRASFSPVVLDPDLLRAWLSFWSMTHRSELVSAVHARTYGDYLDTLEGLLRELGDEEAISDLDPRLAAVGLSGLLDGLWVEWCLNSRTFSPEQGVALCNAFLVGLTRASQPTGAAHAVCVQSGS